jgi:hypothetical protein
VRATVQTEDRRSPAILPSKAVLLLTTRGKHRTAKSLWRNSETDSERLASICLDLSQVA